MGTPQMKPPPGLRLLPTSEPQPQAPPRTALPTGGSPLDWDQVPKILGEHGREEWAHLAEEFRSEPNRVLEADRVMLTAWCTRWEVYALATLDIVKRGPMVKARSSADDPEALVKNPSLQVQRDAGQQLLALARYLGFTPVTRARIDLQVPDAKAAHDDNNPY